MVTGTCYVVARRHKATLPIRHEIGYRPVLIRSLGLKSGTGLTKARGDSLPYSRADTQYVFRIRHGSYSNDLPVDSQNDDAAWNEAAATCSDMIRDTITRLGDSPEWPLEVADKSGTVRHLFRLTAENFDP
jgi:hypothetical protein